MSANPLQQGIEAVQAGDMTTADQLLRTALADPNLVGRNRSIALMWLAETNPNPQFKIDCLRKAVAADSTNDAAKSHLEGLVAAQQPAPPPSGPPTSMPGTGQPTTLPSSPPATARQQTTFMGITGGENGNGTAFFVHIDGLLVTTRYAVGSQTKVGVLTGSGQTIEGHVSRAYTQYDLAFVRVNIPINKLPPLDSQFDIPEETPLTAQPFGMPPINAVRRSTRREIPRGWFPTTFSTSPNAGGSPILDQRNMIIGMLTRNADRSSGLLYGLTMHLIQTKLTQYLQEAQTSANFPTCSTCGNLSRAAAAGLPYCDTCGATFPQFQGRNLARHPQASQYYE